MNSYDKPRFKIDLWDYIGDVPPPFGHPMLEFFSFDPGYINLNHGAFGSLPTPVHRVCTVLSDHIEANPDKFFTIEYHALLLLVRKRLAKLIGAEMDECVLVSNATTAAASILHGLGWKKGDIIVSATTTFANLSRTVQYIHYLNPQVTLAEFPIVFPKTHAELLKEFREFLQALPRPEPTDDNPSPKVICVIDAIVSNPGIYMPWKEMVRICKEQDVLSIVDAAHAIGQETHINLSEVQPDFWFSNCHKWLYAKRSCTVLYVPKRNQRMVKSSIPTSVAFAPAAQTGFHWMDEATGDLGDKWAENFEWPGTRDVVPYLSINAALDFREWLGGEDTINTQCRTLALEGGKRLAEILGTSLMDQSPNGEETLNMVNVKLPLHDIPADKTGYVQATLHDRLLSGFNTYAAHFPHNGRFWVRCSAQIFNELSDFEYLGKALLQVCKEISDNVADGQ